MWVFREFTHCYGLNSIPSKMQSLIPSTSECDLYGEWVFLEIVKLKCDYWGEP